MSDPGSAESSAGARGTQQELFERSTKEIELDSGLSRYESKPPRTSEQMLARSIAVGWSFSETSVSPHDDRRIAVVVAVDQLLKSVDHEGEREKSRLLFERKFIVKTRPRAISRSDADVSGLLGLLSPWGTADDQEAHEQFERTLADVQMWGLYEALERSRESSGRVAILLQGPLLPKLRGRLYYRLLDVQETPLYVVTSEPRWLGRLTATTMSSSALGMSGEYKWSGPLPDLALDSPARDFVGWKLGRPAVHVHVPANAVSTESVRDFCQDSRQDLEELFRDGTPCDLHRAVELPETLATAVTESRKKQLELFADLAGVAEVQDVFERANRYQEPIPRELEPVLQHVIGKNVAPAEMATALRREEATVIPREMFAEMLGNDALRKAILEYGKRSTGTWNRQGLS